MALPTIDSNLQSNPLSGNITGMAAGAIAPNLGVTAGSANGGGGLTQGTPLPNITTTQQQATATPQFYTDYLNQLAKQGAASAQNAQFAGASPLQQQAYTQAGSNVGNYLPTLNAAADLAGSAGKSNIAQALGNLNQSNIVNNLSPGATAGIVGSGQFGSSRGAGALGQVINQADIATQAQQAAGMQQDYSNRIAAANSLNNIAGQTQALGLGDVNALSTLGSQQQTIAQNQQLFPMQQLQAEANLLKGATIPTATSSSYTGPIPGAYNASPLSQIAGLGSLASGVSDLIPGISKGVSGLNLSNPFSSSGGSSGGSGGSSGGSSGSSSGSSGGSGGLPTTDSQAAANASQVEANLPIDPSTGEKMTMQDYNYAINGWVKNPDGSWSNPYDNTMMADTSGSTAIDTTTNPWDASMYGEAP